ncbi:LdpA C-terminal domain-containing domain [Synechococcus sp. PCC 7336]|uniref:Light dependent period protein LdpA domain-containing protein n=1 Tax=Synechococcus sp. PCC 7336 TaxID=195250 RepID=UPI00034581CB|nr:LdpA C-terminal domain-containing domain [Synechococcus sp. PCC 7336]
MLARSPSESLQQGRWFKLIGGASLHHLPSVRNLAFVFTAAGADCIDVAADPAVMRAARMGVAAALEQYPDITTPWLMASFNDGEDPHFRKATAIAHTCPSDCPQPCISSCPPLAIAATETGISIHAQLCYGCGRCEPLCPHDLIRTENYRVAAASTMPQLVAMGVQAIEIHTRIGREREFASLWQQLSPWIGSLELVSVSFNDGRGLADYLQAIVAEMQPLPRHLIWQVDGRPMSGDIGAGTTRATLRLAAKVLGLGLPGFIQLAGGTNPTTMPKARQLGLRVAGAAFGSYARQLVAEATDPSENDRPPLASQSPALAEAIAKARHFVSQVKGWPEPEELPPAAIANDPQTALIPFGPSGFYS